MKYEILVIQEIDSSHQLKLPYESGCNNLHGHRWRIEVCICSKVLNNQDMVVDFQHVKRVIKDFDHIHLNSQVENPTAESVAEAIFARIRVFILSDTFGNKDAYVKYLKLFETLSGSVTIWPS